MMAKPTTRTASDTQENRIVKKLGGTRSSNSGAGKFRKGDVHIREANLLVECKTCLTEKDSFSIKKEWIIKNKEEAFQNRLGNTAIAFNFYYDDATDYYVIDDKLMKYLVEKLKEDNE